MSIVKIYKIVSDKGPKCYVGSTGDYYLCNRFSDHKTDWRGGLRKATSAILFNEYGPDSCRIELIEEYEYKEPQERYEREQYWINNTPDAVNKRPAHQTDEQKKEKANKKSMKYYENHKEAIKDKRKETVQCECGLTLTKFMLPRHQTSKVHKERMGEIETVRVSEETKLAQHSVRSARYYEKNKGKIAEKMKETITCECGSVVVKHTLQRHLRSVKHQNYLTQQ